MKIISQIFLLFWLGSCSKVALSDGSSWTLTPLGKRPGASSGLTLGATITWPPCLQSTGVATFLLAVSWRLSMARMISSKFLPVVAGYRMDSFNFLSGPITNTALQVRGMPALSLATGSNMEYFMAISLDGSAMMG